MKKQSTKSWWIKERHNPQFNGPYYILCGQLSKREAKKKEKSLYGYNYMMEYETEEEYLNAIHALKSDGHDVH